MNCRFLLFVFSMLAIYGCNSNATDPNSASEQGLSSGMSNGTELTEQSSSSSYSVNLILSSSTPTLNVYSSSNAIPTISSSSNTLLASSSSFIRQNNQLCSYSAVNKTLICAEQTYQTVVIGVQVWMAENLNYIPSTGNSSCYASGDGTHCTIYGRYYDWKTANTVCPNGWHLPSDDDWKSLETYLGMSVANLNSMGFRGTDQGSKIKSTTYHWLGTTPGTNSSGFTALPAGYSDGSFNQIGQGAYFWTSSTYVNTLVPTSPASAITRSLLFNASQVIRLDDPQAYELSVRCLKD